jgi:hypothetical protein
MKHRFTPEQLAKQNKLRHEENFELATNIISALMWIPGLSLLLPFLPLLPIIMQWTNFGIKTNRRNALYAEQKVLNAQKKEMLIKKGEVIKQLAELGDIKAISAPINKPKPSNINLSTTVQGSGGVMKRKYIDTSLIKPTNFLFNTLKTDKDTARNIISKRST